MCGVTTMHKMRNEYIREIFGVINIAVKMRENILKQFGHAEKK